MKTIPFPYALNIGTDIVHLPRITRLLTSRPNYLSRFTQRILSDSEQRDFHKRFKGLIQSPPSLSPSQSIPKYESTSTTTSNSSSRSQPITPEITRWLAGRFAAKEAARKASPAGAAAIGWKDVIVRVEEDTRSLNGSGSGSGSVAGQNEGSDGHTATDGTSRRPEIVYVCGEEVRVGKLSISHDGDYVVATVLAAG